MHTMPSSFTRTDWERLPEGFPAQLIQGALVKEPAPSYGHQRIASRIHLALATLLGPDRVPLTPADVLVDEENVFQPDVVALPVPADDASSYVGVPLLVVEVLSPSTRERDRGVKAEGLIRLGVAEVWLVDPDARTIEVRTSGGNRLARGGDRIASQALPAFALDVDDLLSPARGS